MRSSPTYELALPVYAGLRNFFGASPTYERWGLNHSIIIFPLIVSDFISSAMELGLQLELRMWHQTADNIFPWADQLFLSGDFSGVRNLYVGKNMMLLAVTVQKTHLAP